MKGKEKNGSMLTDAEKRRLERFEKISEDMIRQGYVRHDLTVGMGKANMFAILLLIPLVVVGFGLYYLVNRGLEFSDFNPLIFIAAIVALTVVHELIHGACWSLFTPHRFKDIEFGIMKPSMTPYCACLVPLKKQQHVFGTVMPLILLGILPMIVAIAIGNLDLLLIGIIMADGAAGDIMIISMILGYRSAAKEIVYMDHPTEAGGVVFER
ncbi:MAG: DUF3267 domain-containing protein [Clostridia bacterium]|nr:DUF3267 domain-containing protein [Clostridia bacterium]